MANGSKIPWLFSTSVPSIHGIPIGNLTSQFFANIYLNGLDHHIKEVLGCRYYLRYMDDFLVLSNDKVFLWKVLESIQDYLKKLDLGLHDKKCRIYSSDMGVPFLGFVIFPFYKRLKRQNLVRFKRRMKKFVREYAPGHKHWGHVNQSINSWLGHAKHADAKKITELVMEEFVFRKQEGGLIIG